MFASAITLNPVRLRLGPVLALAAALAAPLVPAAAAPAAEGKAAKAEVSAPAAEALADIQKSFGFIPRFFKEIPESILPGAWEEMKAIEMDPNTALPGK